MNDLHLFLLIGQSNMAGRAEIEEQDKAPPDRVCLLNDKDEWEPATNPLNRYSTIRKDLSMQRLGPGYTFAKSVAATKPDATLGLIVNPRGGSSVDEWVKGSEYYTEAVRRTRTAQESGTLKAILWHQGESDRHQADQYIMKLTQFIHDLRADLDAADVPFIAGEIGYFVENAEPVNKEIIRLPAQVPMTDCVSAEGLTDSGDAMHFGPQAQRTLGERYAEKVLQMVYGGP